MNPEIQQLQDKITFQEDLLATLNQQISAQQKDILWLKDQFKYLYKKLEDMQLIISQTTSKPEDQPPPHY